MTQPNDTVLLDLVRALSDRPIAFNPAYARLAGSVTAGLFLSQAMYWSMRTKHDDGWFYKSQIEWSSETAMSRTEIETARKRLRSLGVLHEKRKGNPARLWYQIDVDRLTNLIAGILQTSLQESRNQDAMNPA